MSPPVLDIQNLSLSFSSHGGVTEVLHGLSLHIKAGERVALVGESGSGKSVTARIVLGVLQELRSARITGAVKFNGTEIGTLSPKQHRALRGREMAMVFQDPASSINPVFTIGDQFHEVLKRVTSNLGRDQADMNATRLLEEVCIRYPERVLGSYAFQLSGGMAQRVMIAMALANEPALLIADEPGTALDVTVQAQTLALMRDLVKQDRTAVLFISHNLGVVREFADRIYVIYKGRIVEQGPTQSVFEGPRHPYTRALWAAVPKLTGGGIPDVEENAQDYLAPMERHDREGAG